MFFGAICIDNSAGRATLACGCKEISGNDVEYVSMLQRRGTTTDRLANVIQVIQLGRKTGILSVKRGEGGTREEGTITFIQGHITQAYAGQRRGQAALPG